MVAVVTELSSPRRLCIPGRPAIGRGLQAQKRVMAVQATVVAQTATWLSVGTVAVAGKTLEAHSPIGRLASAPVVVMALAAAAVRFGFLPSSSVVYTDIWEWVMPMGAALSLLEADVADVARLWKSVRPVATAWAIGAVGVVGGTLGGWMLLHDHLGTEGAKVAAALAASYIGGSLNFAATASALSFAPGALMAGAMAADNVAMAIYLAVISSWPVPEAKADGDKTATDSGLRGAGSPSFSVSCQQEGRTEAGEATPAAAAMSAGVKREHAESLEAEHLFQTDDGALSSPAPQQVPEYVEAKQASAGALVAAVTAAAVACVLGRMIAVAIGFTGGDLACMAVVAVGLAALATALPHQKAGRQPAASASAFAGCGRLGGALMLPFFVSIGAAAGSLGSISALGWLFALIAVQLTVHLMFSVIAGRLLGIPLDAILTASNANIGGPATAAATATARGWPHMVQPAVLTGSIGYAVGTAVGCGIYVLLKIL